MRWLNWLIDSSGVSVTLKTCEQHKKELENAKKEIETWKKDFELAIEVGNKLKEQIEILNQVNRVNKLEHFWNEKRPKRLVTWNARDGIKMDVRCFFQTDDTLPKFTGTNDEKVADILAFTILNIKYVADKEEQWQFSFETIQRKKGDCEDMAILMSNLAVNSGVDYWRIRLNKGFVKLGKGKGYHCFMTYLTEKDNEWKMVDAAYWPEESRDLKLDWKKSEKYFEPDASWNSKFAFMGLNKE